MYLLQNIDDIGLQLFLHVSLFPNYTETFQWHESHLFAHLCVSGCSRDWCMWVLTVPVNWCDTTGFRWQINSRSRTRVLSTRPHKRGCRGRKAHKSKRGSLWIAFFRPNYWKLMFLPQRLCHLPDPMTSLQMFNMSSLSSSERKGKDISSFWYEHLISARNLPRAISVKPGISGILHSNLFYLSWWNSL